MKLTAHACKRVLALVLALVMTLSLVPVTASATNLSGGEVLYLKPNSNWLEANARFAAYFYGTGNTWASMTEVESGVYQVTVPSGSWTNVIFCRMNPGTTVNSWDSGTKWNQTGDLVWDGSGNCYSINAGQWDSDQNGSWSSYTPPVTDEEEADLPTTLYLKPNSFWNTDAPRFAAYFYNDAAGTNTWVDMTGPDSEGCYAVTVPTGYPSVIFCRMNPGTTENNWNDGTKWNQTVNLTIPSDGTNCFTLTTDSWDSGTWSAYTPASSGEEEDPAEPVTDVTVHFRNTGVWSSVYLHAWIENGDSDETITGTWPGQKLTQDTDHTNWYTVTLNEIEAPNGIGLLFNNGGDSGKTPDIMITANDEYWYDGQLLTEAPADTWPDGSVATVDYKATFHFADAKNWGSACLYTWTVTGSNPTGSWPGTQLSFDGKFYTGTAEYQAPQDQGLNFIFSGAGQTIDLLLEASRFTLNEETDVYEAEVWVVPNAYTDDEGKCGCDIVAHPDAIAISPIVNGQSVTFQYKDASATSVEVRGTMSGDNWATGYSMSKNDYGVWSVTVDNVPYGIHEYKFIVSGTEWKADPLNTWSQNGNSALLVSDPNLDNNAVTVRVHYTRADSAYDNWNVYAWGTGVQGQFDFEAGTGGVVTSIPLVGRDIQSISFKVRKSVGTNEWVDQSGEINVNLTKIVSGTIDVYVGFDGENWSVSQALNADVVYANKVTSVELDYDTNTVAVQTVQAVNDSDTAFILVKGDETFDISVTLSGNRYILSLPQDLTLDLVTLYQYKIFFTEQIEAYRTYPYAIGYSSAYASDRFAEEFTYEGDDLGAVWSKTSTTFRLWAPTAESISLWLYSSGTAEDYYDKYPMTKAENGTWTAVVEGDLNGVYYTYWVYRDGQRVEAVDPYARTTGINGKRGMVLNLDSTDPEGWEDDSNPNPITSYTDAIIYELHVRDFSIDDSSGITNKGKFLAFTEEGTTTAGGMTTGIDYLDELGITHLHLLPIYDYGSVDETLCENFNWGYDPVNYNVPEGSYSTDPANGEVRVNEMKQMVQSLHDHDISVIMDVVYNHVYDSGLFCFNQIVPGYFSRTNSNRSGCGNDTASEREMVRKYIVESVLYWTEEYHIDGFRFDLVGLLDVQTINEIVTEVHKIRPDVIFYGEGWDMDDTNREPGTEMAKQGNADKTPGFGYFSDSMRNLLGGNNGNSLGYVSGYTGQEEPLSREFMAQPWWTTDPTQVVQYASCHDNYTLIDKMVISMGKAGKSYTNAQLVAMNNLAAAVYMTAQGIPFIHAGEEMLREKLEEDGRCENSYNASDDVNKIRWDHLEGNFYDSGISYADNVEYYKGLIAFRKAHAALRMDTAQEIADNVTYTWVNSEVVKFTVNAKEAGDVADSIIVIFNATGSNASVPLPTGEWSVCIDKNDSGTTSLRTVSGSVSVSGLSAMVLVQGQTCGHSYVRETASSDTACEYCGDIQEYAATEIVSNSISLKGNIDLNYYMTLTEDALADEDACMRFTMADGEIIEMPLSQGREKVIDGKAYYVFSLNVPAKEMNDTVTAQFIYGDNECTEEKTFSVQSYAQYVLNDTTGTYSEELKNMVRAMLHYGAYAQKHFGHNADSLANAGLETVDMTGISAQDLVSHAVMGESSEYCGNSLILKGETTLRFFFRVADGESVTVSMDGTPLDISQRSGMHYVSVENISAKDLDEAVTLTVTGGDGSTTVTCSPLTYAYNVLSAEAGTYSDDLIDLVKALYLYNEAANTYFNN